MRAACNVLQLHRNTLLDPLPSPSSRTTCGFIQRGISPKKHDVKKNPDYGVSLRVCFCQQILLSWGIVFKPRGGLQCCLRACIASRYLADAAKRRTERKQRSSSVKQEGPNYNRARTDLDKPLFSFSMISSNIAVNAWADKRTRF